MDNLMLFVDRLGISFVLQSLSPLLMLLPFFFPSLFLHQAALFIIEPPWNANHQGDSMVLVCYESDTTLLLRYGCHLVTWEGWSPLIQTLVEFLIILDLLFLPKSAQ
jgi:hypothetical protein